MLKSQMKEKSTLPSSYKRHRVVELGLKEGVGLSRDRKECIQGRERWAGRQELRKVGLAREMQVQAKEVLMGLPTGHSCPVSSENF